MSFDNSRFTFNPWKNYSGVVMEQGRVQLDADWNEWLSEVSRRIQAGTLDIMGHAAYPPTTPSAFQITATASPNTVAIGPGRMYVDGLLAENHGVHANASWDPALAELSGSPQPPPSSPSVPNPDSVDFTKQPYLPGATIPTLPSGVNSYLAYLDVWTRPVTWLEDPHLVDIAVGVDTTGRLQTVWQVKLMPNTGGWSCSTPDAQIGYPANSAGQLSTGVQPNATAGPCCLTDGSGYTGVENQFYRVEIHNPGQPGNTPASGVATFKWSRDNVSVETAVTAITTVNNPLNPAQTVSQLTVTSLGRDQVLGFKNGDWIELLDDWSELWGNPGILCQIGGINVPASSITLTTTIDTSVAVPSPGSTPTFPVTSKGNTHHKRHTRIRRWDQSGKVYDIHGTQWCDLNVTGGLIPVPASGTTLVLENGITVNFSLSKTTGGTPPGFNVSDFWTFAARTADGSVEKLDNTPPRGIHHHYTKLSVVSFGPPASYTDCRTEWGCSCEGGSGCCSVTVGDNVNSFGKYSRIQDAINSLPTTGPIIGGEVCILPGQYNENFVINGLTDIVIRGCGPETRLGTPLGPQSPQSGGPAQGGYSSNTGAAQSGLGAVITILNSQHIQISSFAIEAAVDQVGILLDYASAQTGSGTGGLQGQVLDPSGAAVEGVLLTASAPGIQLSVTTTNASGQYVFSNLTPGKYTVSANAVGFATAQNVVNVVAGQVVQLNISMVTGNPEQNEFLYADTDITIKDLVITASTLPAILANDVDLLQIINNRIAMQDVSGQWAAVYVSGAEIHIEDNWIGRQDAANATTWIPSSVVGDVGSGFDPTSAPTTGNGGIHIAADSADVFVIENEIEGGAFNGITLGSFILIPPNQTTGDGALTGLTPSSQTASLATTLLLPGADSSGNQLAAGAPLQNIQIERNRIRNTGLCGIGPIGFFTLQQAPEIIGIANLTIIGNTISSTLQGSIAPVAQGATGIGYGAICLPDVQNLIVYDNIIADFGSTPGSGGCGIFLLSGEQVEISRNQVIETRDWSEVPSLAASTNLGPQSGIAIVQVSPPLLDQSQNQSDWTCSGDGVPPLYQPGLPALRLEQNVVRLPLGQALKVLGFGPFSIVNNHLSSGGTIPAPEPTGGGQLNYGVQFPTGVLTVEVINTGLGIDIEEIAPGISAVEKALSKLLKGGLNSASGAVLFTNNICQLETRSSGAIGLASVVILTLDHLIFSNNHCWVDGCKGSPRYQYFLPFTAAITDVVLVAPTIQATGNRLQESLGSVFCSGATAGLMNLTAQNITTFCLYAVPATNAVNNLSPTTGCKERLAELLKKFEALLSAGPL